MTARNLTIIEPECNGHHMHYVRLIAGVAASRGLSVVLVTSSDCLNSYGYRLVARDLGGSITTQVIRSINSRATSAVDLVGASLANHRLFKASVAEAETVPDIVVVPYADSFIHAAALLRRPFNNVRWTGIVMRPTFHLSSMGAKAPKARLDIVKERLFLKVLRDPTLNCLLTIDESLSDYVAAYRPESMHKLVYLPDPAIVAHAPDKEAARKMLGIPDDLKIILVYGSLTVRKGIDALFRALSIGIVPSEVGVLLAGSQDDHVRNLMTSTTAVELGAQGRLFALDKYLTAEEESAALSAADLSWLGYRNHFTMSGVLVQSAAAGLPTIACEEGVIGWLTRKHVSGLVVATEDERQVANAIRELVANRERYETMRGNALVLARLHSIARFEQVFSDAILRDPVDDGTGSPSRAGNPGR